MKEGGSRHSHDASKIDSGESSSVFLLADTIHPSSYRNGSQIEGKAIAEVRWVPKGFVRMAVTHGARFPPVDVEVIV